MFPHRWDFVASSWEAEEFDSFAIAALAGDKAQVCPLSPEEAGVNPKRIKRAGSDEEVASKTTSSIRPCHCAGPVSPSSSSSSSSATRPSAIALQTKPKRRHNGADDSGSNLPQECAHPKPLEPPQVPHFETPVALPEGSVEDLFASVRTRTAAVFVVEGEGPGSRVSFVFRAMGQIKLVGKA